MIWFVPESHIHHARRGEHEKAKRSMLTLYGNVPNYDVVRRYGKNSAFKSDLSQEYEYRVIQHGIEIERQLSEVSTNSSFFEIFQGINWRRTLAGCTGICSQWAAGAPIVFGYSTVRRLYMLQCSNGMVLTLHRSTFSRSLGLRTLS